MKCFILLVFYSFLSLCVATLISCKTKNKSTRVAFSVQNRVGKTLLVYSWPFWTSVSWTTLFCCLTLVTQAKYSFFMIGQLLKESLHQFFGMVLLCHGTTRKPGHWKDYGWCFIRWDNDHLWEDYLAFGWGWEVVKTWIQVIVQETLQHCCWSHFFLFASYLMNDAAGTINEIGATVRRVMGGTSGIL